MHDVSLVLGFLKESFKGHYWDNRIQINCYIVYLC